MRQRFLPILAVAAMVAGPAMAQNVGEPSMAGHHGSSAPTAKEGSVSCMDKMSGMAQHTEDRLASMRTKLKITNEQMPQWNAFADAMRENARRMTEMHQKMAPTAAMSAPERLDRMEKMTTGMMEAAQSTKAAFMPLYSAMTADQKKTADTLAPAGFGWG